MDQRALLRRLLALDQEALEVVYDAFQPLLYRYAYRLLGRIDAAEEVVGETFLRLLEGINRGQGPKRNLSAWLYRVVHNLAMDRYRQGFEKDLPLEESLLSTMKGPEEELQSKWTQERVRRALHQLTEDQQQVILLRCLERLSNKEVASVLGKSVGAVKALQHRAMAALRRALERYPDLDGRQSDG